MAKKKKDEFRPHQPSKQPLFVVGGLPSPTDATCERVIRDEFAGLCGIVHTATGVADNDLYNENYSRQLITSMMAFTRVRRNAQSVAPTPGRICFLYVPTKDADALVEKLDFAVFPIKLAVLAERNEKGKMWRHDPKAVADSLRMAVKEYKAAHLHFNRIDLRREADAIFLPPQNFELKGGMVMRDLFSEMRRGQRRWDDRFPEAEVQQYKAGDFPTLAAPSKFRRDVRKIVFVEPHPTAYHGNKWNDDHQAVQDDLLMLKSLYRFGGALPAGYQHDAQREKGKLFKREPFNCSVNGEINVSDDHADIYPNDYIRHRTK